MTILLLLSQTNNNTTTTKNIDDKISLPLLFIYSIFPCSNTTFFISLLSQSTCADSSIDTKHLNWFKSRAIICTYPHYRFSACLVYFPPSYYYIATFRCTNLCFL